MANPDPKTFIKYFFFMFVFIVSFFLIGTTTVETFGLILFFVVNLIFCTVLGKNLTDGSISYKEGDSEQTMRYWVLLISLIFSFVSSIMMMMTIVTLQTKYAEKNTSIKWDKFNRKSVNETEILFMTVTTFIGVVALYVYNGTEYVQRSTSFIFESILNSSWADWLRVTFPIVLIGLGSALYGRLEMQPLVVQKIPMKITCDPKSDMRDFKKAFIKTYWFLFAYVIIILLRPIIEANFYDFLIPDNPILSTGRLMGFPLGDRTLVFGQNAAISLGSFLSLGVYSLLTNPLEIKKAIPVIILNLIVLIAYFLILIYVIGPLFEINMYIIYLIIALFGVGIIGYFIYCLITTKPITKALNEFLQTTIIRWDTIYIILKYGFALAGLVFAAYTLNLFKDLPAENPCLLGDAYIRQLYIAFISFLTVFYAFNTLSSYVITDMVTVIMRYLVPPSLIGLSTYLIYKSNNLMKLAPQIILE